MIEIRIRGLKEVEKDLTAKQVTLVRKVARAIQIESSFAAQFAKLSAPRETGTLAGSIQAIRPTVTPQEIVGGAKTGVDYAVYQEYGIGRKGAATGGLPPPDYTLTIEGFRAKLFMKKAGEQSKPRLEAAIKRVMGE